MVKWEATIGAVRDGRIEQEGWNSKYAYAIGRNDNYYLCVWDSDPESHGHIMVSCAASPVLAGEDVPLEPYRLVNVGKESCWFVCVCASKGERETGQERRVARQTRAPRTPTAKHIALIPTSSGC
jgi:hypothetical protein